MNIQNKYEKLINFFYEISKIPRNSTMENKIADWLCKFANERNLEYRKDELLNVLIKKKASKGYENRKPIIFQAHTDMVCEKIAESNHDFSKDGIEIINDGVTLKAKDTTLGADDGIGIATLLLFLDDDELCHPDIYCLFTTQEEIGMDGAKFFDYSDIKASYLINVDGEEENTAIVGCAGGARLRYEKECIQEDVDNRNTYQIVLKGLRGGHSGVDINKGRQNSNYLIATILNNIEDCRISLFEGGNKDNAIPNSTRCVFHTNKTKENIEKIINDVINKVNITEDDKEFKIILEICDTQKAFSEVESKIILNMILHLKQGVINFSKDKDGLVETSGNIGIVIAKDNKIIITELLRSSDDDYRIEIENENNEFAKINGYKIRKESEYPGWKYKPNSNLEKVYIESYKHTHNNTPKVEAIHAGVECGMIFKKMPNLELISIGPDLKDVHTTNETLYLDSCKKVLETIIKMVELLD